MKKPPRRPTAVKTSGEGQRTTAHLNLTLTMADVMADEERVASRGPRSKKIIAEGYAQGWSKYQIAEAAGIVPQSVKVIASRCGIRRPKKAAAKRRLPFAGQDRTSLPWAGQ